MLSQNIETAKPVLSKKEKQRLERRTLKISLYTIIFIAFGSIAYGVYIKSDVVILNGLMSMVSLLGSVLNLWGSKLVASPENNRFQYGFAHIEPLIHCANALIILVICVYAFLNSIEGLRTGGHQVDYTYVIGFSAVTGVITGSIWLHEFIMGRRIDSQFVKNDSKEWLMDFCFSLITLIGFVAVIFLDYPLQDIWQRYADSVMVMVLSVLLLPLPLKVLMRNVPEVLLITNPNEMLVERITSVMDQISSEHKIINYTKHIVKVGPTYFVEVNILVAPNCELQTIAQQDELRERIWRACEKPLDELWLTVCITADPRWR